MSVPPLAANSTSPAPSHSAPTTDPTVLLSLATEYIDRGDLASACDLLRRLVELQPESGQAWVSLARTYYLQGDFTTSFSTYQRALSSKKDGNCEAQLWYGIGLLSCKVKDYDNAIAMLKMVLTVDPQFKESGEVWLELGQIYRERENWPEAVRAWKQSAAQLKGSRQAKALCELGLGHEELDEGEAALSCYRKALESDPKTVRPAALLGWALRMDKGLALTTLTQVLSLCQGSPKDEALIHYLIGRVLHLHSLSACHELQTALELDPANPVYLASMAVAHFEAKDWQTCEAHLCKVAALLPDQSLVWYDLGVLHEARSRKAEAKQAYERASELDKGRFQAAKARLANTEWKMVPEMLHPVFDIEENGLTMRVRAVDVRPAPVKQVKVRTPVFKVTRAEPVSKPVPAGKKRGRLDHSRGCSVQRNADMYQMMPFFCMPPQGADPKAQPNGFPGYFPNQMMYYPYMVPYYMPQPEPGPNMPPAAVPQPPSEKPVTEAIPSSPSSADSGTVRPPVDLDDLISDDSDQVRDSDDEGGSIDGIHIGGKRRVMQKPAE